MKCIHCQSDTKYPARQKNGGRCEACKHPFAFEPKTDALGVADGLFQRAIDDVSGKGHVHFTDRQLWYEFNRRLWKKAPPQVTGGAALGAISVPASIALCVVAHAAWPLTIAIGGVAAGVALHRRQKRERDAAPRAPKLDWETFQASYLQRWTRAHGPIAKLLPAWTAPADAPAPAADITAFSFDRALVLDHAPLAAMLVANQFHFENNCAVLSADGFPGPRAETILTMLRRNPKLLVFALHDASPDGCRLPQILRQDAWFPDSDVRVIDLGLRPSHAQKLGLLVRTGPAMPSLSDLSLPADEAAWLETGNWAELAGLRPAKLMRAVYQGFARANQMAADSGNGGTDGMTVWGYDSGADIYAADSFG